MKKVEDYVRSIPDFPEPGIIFRDITTVLQDPDGLKLAIDGLKERLDGVDFDVVVGAESRGFIFGAPLAYEFGKGFVPVRKKGKLPCETVCAKYDLEYGSAEIEMHKDSIKPGQKAFLINDFSCFYKDKLWAETLSAPILVTRISNDRLYVVTFQFLTTV